MVIVKPPRHLTAPNRHTIKIPELLPRPHCLKAIFSRNFALFFNKPGLDSIQMIGFRAGKHEYVAFR